MAYARENQEWFTFPHVSVLVEFDAGEEHICPYLKRVGNPFWQPHIIFPKGNVVNIFERAIVAHELGHYFTQEPMIKGLLEPQARLHREIEADAYAADLVGVEEMIDLLWYIVIFVRRLNWRSMLDRISALAELKAHKEAQ